MHRPTRIFWANLTPFLPQRKWLLTMQHITDVKMQKGHAIGEVGGNPLRQRVLAIVVSKRFEEFVMLVIIVNCFQMVRPARSSCRRGHVVPGAVFGGSPPCSVLVPQALTHRDEPEALSMFSAITNEICTVIFTAEAALKIYAFGAVGYFSITWNRFDFAVVCGSWLSILLKALEYSGVNTAMFRIVQVTRVIGRVMRIFRIGNRDSELQVNSTRYLLVLLNLVRCWWRVQFDTEFGRVMSAAHL